MAAKKKLTSDDIEYRLKEYGACEDVKTSVDVERVLNSRWKLHEKVRGVISRTDSDDVKQALKFALEVIVDEIQVLAMLKQAKDQLEEPHVAAWIKLTERVERLSEELDRADGSRAIACDLPRCRRSSGVCRRRRSRRE